MSDLLSSLLIPKSSQESFHSASSHPGTQYPSSPPSPSHQNQPLSNPHSINNSNNNSTTTTNSPPPLSSVSTFLSSPATTSLLQAPTPSKTPHQTTITPLPLSSGPHSAASVSRFYELCQDKGLTPLFAITEDPARAQWFGGSLAVGAATLVLAASQPSKKEARQVLAEQGCALVRGVVGRVGRGGEADEEKGIVGAGAGENWVGRLLEFSAHHPSLSVPTFTDFADFAHGAAAFACECRLPQRPGRPFGGADVLFASKKAAKAHAAREAVRFLIGEGELAADGSVKGRKTKKGGGMVRAEREREGEAEGEGIGHGNKHEAGGEKSWVERVLDLCTALNIHPPTYRLAALDPATAPHVYSGAARFESEPLMRQPVGEVRHVFGRKNAREECARGVVAYLEGVRRGRGGGGV